VHKKELSIRNLVFMIIYSFSYMPRVHVLYDNFFEKSIMLFLRMKVILKASFGRVNPWINLTVIVN
jgi:hypothetical protein